MQLHFCNLFKENRLVTAGSAADLPAQPDWCGAIAPAVLQLLDVRGHAGQPALRRVTRQGRQPRDKRGAPDSAKQRAPPQVVAGHAGSRQPCGHQAAHLTREQAQQPVRRRDKIDFRERTAVNFPGLQSAAGRTVYMDSSYDVQGWCRTPGLTCRPLRVEAVQKATVQVSELASGGQTAVQTQQPAYPDESWCDLKLSAYLERR